MRAIKYIAYCLFVVSLFAECAWAMELKSRSFQEDRYIPAVYSCQGEDRSPELSWNGVPEGVKSFALVCEDPDAPLKVWIHWVVYNIAPETRSLSVAASNSALLPHMTIEGINDFAKIGYGGPCPPPGQPHHYLFRLFALDTALVSDKPMNRKELEKAMKGHVIAEAVLTGLFQR
jgi:Raf kinase inhibitor-like YbhB/YbcL family protein